MIEFVQGWITAYGYAALFGILMFGIVGVPFPDDLTLAFSGYLVSAGHLNPYLTLISAFLGSVCGITVSYGLGHFLGTLIVGKYGRIFHVTPEKLKTLNDWYVRFGKWSLLVGYFVAGVRHFNALFAGAAKLQFSVFALFAYLGAFLWSLTLISTGYVLGKEWGRISEYTGPKTLIVAVVLALLVALYVFGNKRYNS